MLDITMYKMHVSLCSYYTIRIPISKTLTGTYEGGYMYLFEMCCYRTLDIFSTPIMLAASQYKRVPYRNCCIYRKVPPDDEH